MISPPSVLEILFGRILTVRNGRRRRAAVWACVMAGAFAPAALEGGEQPIRYLLDLRDPASHLVRVTMQVPEAAGGTEFQFPAWNALYQIRDFVRNVQDVEARCDDGHHDLTRVDLYTWQSGPEACEKLEFRYRVYANEEGVFSAVLNNEHAFMNFALLLFYLPKERERDVRVRFLLPEGWNLATLLDDAESPGEFAACDYDALVDSPAEAGTFQLHA
ncbi:MAG: hypothetical protein HYS33_09565, partial [Acidobacteria bacterium]|nr:hypothetical protein [Acidobacteriota bacterium]